MSRIQDNEMGNWNEQLHPYFISLSVIRMR